METPLKSDVSRCALKAQKAGPETSLCKSDAGRRERLEVGPRSAAVLTYGEHRRAEIGPRSSPGPIYLSSALAPASTSFF